jgi:multicomponent Na+:H+ antiporter subunit F
MLAAAMFAVLLATALMVARAVRGPSVFDRLVAGNAVGNAAILILALYGFLTGRPDFLDIGLTYAMLNIIGTFAVLKFLRFGALGHAEEEGG